MSEFDTQTDANKALCRRFYKAITDASETELVAICAPTAQFTVMGQTLDFAGHAALVRGFHGAFPDAEIVIEDMVAEQDRVFTRGYFTGRHVGTFQGLPATGKTVRVPTLGFHRLSHGRVVEHRGEMAAQSLMAQLGVTP